VTGNSSEDASAPGGSRGRLAAVAAFILVEAAICVLRTLAVRPQMTDPVRVRYLFLWGFAGTVVVAAVLSLRRDASWRIPLALLAPDLLVFAVQRATRSVEGQFYALNFVTPWQVGVVAAWAGGIFARAPIPSPGPSRLGKPVWRWGLFLVYFSLLFQATPKPRLLDPFLQALAFLMFAGLLLGLALFVVGGAMRLARRR
jgi:hypothetical protein